MTIAVIWPEDGLLWCASDTRLVAGTDDKTTSDATAKIYSIPLSISAFDPAVDPSFAGHVRREPHFRTQFGFVYAGAALPASQTAITASTILQNLARPGDRWDPPRFEEIADFMRRLACRFMQDKRNFGGDGLFHAGFFGWCHHTNRFKVASIEGRADADCFRVELSYPARPQTEGEPWLVLGSGAKAFAATMEKCRQSEPQITKRVPRRAIDLMLVEGVDKTVGGATSIGAAHERGFEMFYAIEPISKGQTAARRIFNGLDLDTDLGNIGKYITATIGIA